MIEVQAKDLTLQVGRGGVTDGEAASMGGPVGTYQHPVL